jgi:hypothetical protein
VTTFFKRKKAMEDLEEEITGLLLALSLSHAPVPEAFKEMHPSPLRWLLDLVFTCLHPKHFLSIQGGFWRISFLK